MSFKRASVNDIKRAFERIKDKFLMLSKVAFSGKYIDLTGTPELGSSAYANIVDNRTTNVKGFVPDATQLAEMQAEIDKLNSTLENMSSTLGIEKIIYTASTNSYGSARIRSNINNRVVLACYANIDNVVCIPYKSGSDTWCLVTKTSVAYETVKNANITFTMFCIVV